MTVEKLKKINQRNDRRRKSNKKRLICSLKAWLESAHKEVELPGLHFTQAPESNEPFNVGDRIEVYCDHDREGERIRDWLEGTVVQVDPKMLAIQFQESVYLTDGWMVPDHVLWCPKDSQNIRPVSRRRKKPRVRPTRMDFGG